MLFRTSAACHHIPLCATPRTLDRGTAHNGIGAHMVQVHVAHNYTWSWLRHSGEYRVHIRSAQCASVLGCLLCCMPYNSTLRATNNQLLIRERKKKLSQERHTRCCSRLHTYTAPHTHNIAHLIIIYHFLFICCTGLYSCTHSQQTIVVLHRPYANYSL